MLAKFSKHLQNSGKCGLKTLDILYIEGLLQQFMHVYEKQ